MGMEVNRFEVYLVALDPTLGSVGLSEPENLEFGIAASP